MPSAVVPPQPGIIKNTDHIKQTAVNTGVDLTAEHLVDNLEAALLEAGSDRPQLDRRNVPTELLGRASNWRLVRYTLIDWVWIGIFWAGMTMSPAWLYPLWAILVAGRIHSFGVILHDACHQSVRKKTLPMRLIEVFAGYPMASTLNAMRYHHIRHHRDSGMPEDPYFKPSVAGNPLMFVLIWLRHLLLIPFWMIRGFYGSIAYFVPSMRNGYAKAFLQEKSSEDLTHQRELIDCTQAEFGQALIHTGLLVFTVMHPGTALFYYFIPALVAAMLAGHRVLIEHNYEANADRKMETIIRTTVDHNLGPIGRLFFAPRNIGYHIVHHLHPQVALENLPRLRQWYIDNYPDLYPGPYNSKLTVPNHPAGNQGGQR
ncbi:MAG: fatty acid desaturase [Hahellaceae bacterium]|nr:fatty acid desaturase [Hahellaceae bacterium]MCP5168870.1 fatty acid desaturase [Hahellaceae bacterium]